ncbi:MAG: cytochrome c [Crocinitomicaceae bacterium]|nr:cytochrome c [Crocinitomicaceae bacterium]
MKRAKSLNAFMRVAIIVSALMLSTTVFSQDDGDSVTTENDTAVVENTDETTNETAVVADETATVEETVILIPDAENGKALFQGEERFAEGGPACVTCHNVNAEGVIPGGLFAKDLTDVYERLGDGLIGWLMAPPFPAMASSYTDNPLTEQERVDLTAFFKETLENKNDSEAATVANGNELFYFGGGFGLLVILGLIQILWMKRKRRMTKQAIFKRQSKAWDAKF